MTGPQMVTLWTNDFDVLASQASPGFLNSEIYSLLNEAYELTILEFYKNKDWTALQALISEVTISSVSSNYANLYGGGGVMNYYCPLPGTGVDTNPVFWLYVDSHSWINRSAMPTTGFAQTLVSLLTNVVANVPISIVEFHEQANSQFTAGSFFKNPLVCINNNQINVLSDSYTIVEAVDVIYVRQYLPISSTQTCELQPSYHTPIVKLAVQLGMQVTHSKEPLKQ